MRSNSAVTALHENIDQRAGAVRDWRVRQLARLGLAWPVAEALPSPALGGPAPCAHCGRPRLALEPTDRPATACDQTGTAPLAQARRESARYLLAVRISGSILDR